MFRGKIGNMKTNRCKPRNCIYCGVEFITPYYQPDKKYCSRKCAANHREESKPDVPDPIYTCEYCKKEFIPNRKKQSFCSKTCSSLHRESSIVREDKSIFCEFCKKKFTPRRVEQRFCSLNCRTSATASFRHLNISKNCEYCGKEYVVNAPNQRFCSVKCGCSIRLNSVRPYSIEKTCKCGCGQTFMDPDWHRNYRDFIGGHQCANGHSPVFGKKLSAELVEFRLIKLHEHFKKGHVTDIEKELYDYLDSTGIVYEKQYQIKTTVPDAYIPCLKLAIYADGIYWHTGEKAEIRDAKTTKVVVDSGNYCLRMLSDKNSKLNLNPLKQYLLQNFKNLDFGVAAKTT
jgi:very-short-patch-repair endonuclease